MVEVDIDRVSAYVLNENAFDVAVDRATEADRAGLEPGEVLEHAICGYMVALETLNYRIVPVGQVMLPRSASEAFLMASIADAYLKGTK